MKKSIACSACRSSKRKCIHSGAPPCDRCRERGDECVFPPKGTSFMFRRARLADQHRGGEPDAARQRSTSSAQSAGELAGPGLSLADVDPFELLTDEVKNSYLRCSYKWSFHHIPNLLKEIQERSLENVLVWAMLAITVRFSQHAPPGYASQVEASNAFGAHARTLVLAAVDQPTLHRAQILLMLTGHSWGAGEGRRAWVYLGMAVRMAQVLGLFGETPATASRQAFIDAEERRRTAWTCFLMDSLLSGCKGRERMLSADHVRHLPLPCDAESFNFGEPVACERLDGSPTGSPGSPAPPAPPLGIIAHSMRVADIWGSVASWACTPRPARLAPWQPASEFQSLVARLDAWQTSLAPRLRYALFTLRAHSVSNQGQAYCYMHCIYFMSVIFLYRSYLPEVEMQEKKAHDHGAAHDDDDMDDDDREWERWSAWSSKELVKVASTVCEMLQEMRTFGLFFLRGLVPWIGFTIYTAVGTLLYFYHFPLADEGQAQVELRRQHIVEGCLFLKDMRQAWPMADTWRERIQTMQIFYSNMKANGEQAVTPSERREMRNAIVDYGALQPSPVVQDAPPESSNDMDMEAPTKMDMERQAMLVAPADTDLFDTYFEIGEAMHASFADTTQGFWEGFPGASGMDIMDKPGV